MTGSEQLGLNAHHVDDLLHVRLDSNQWSQLKQNCQELPLAVGE